MSRYVPVYIYAKENGVPAQTVYRWIREGKLTDIKKERRVVERILVGA